MLERLETLLKTLIGLDIETIGRGTIERALRTRLAACRVDQAAYLGLLEQSAAERQALIEAVVVPETWFFRYPEAFALLAERARALRATRGPAPLRILSLPCSTGEEPYSIAMCLLDAGFAAAELRIDAVDVSQHALDAAAAARYGANSFRSADTGFRDRHFRTEAGGHVLDEAVRATVSLRAGNLLDATLMPGPASYDFVFCRNLLIYFDRATQLQALARLERWLSPGGLLFVGPAEAGMIRQQGLQALERTQSFAFMHRAAVPAPTPMPPAWPPAARPLPALRPQPRVAARVPLPAPAPPTGPVMPSDAALAGLARIERLADAGQIADALAACAQQLQRFGPSAALFYWWGLLCDGERRSADAESYYRKALYLEPRHAEALAHLAALLAARGDQAGAHRLQQRLKQQGERRADA